MRQQQDQQTYDGHPGAVRSDPVPVPPPPPEATAGTDRHHDRDGREEQPRDPYAEELDETRFHEPAPQPTAFGASTVGGAAAAAALAGHSRSETPDVRDEDTAEAGDGVVDDRSDSAAGVAAAGRRDLADAVDAGAQADGPVRPSPSIFTEDAARGFRDRWRDVQLRFVDDPRGAATEAQELAEEAVESLTTMLATRKKELGGWRDGEAETERLREVVRHYRDLLDRLLGL
jgi:hypothetical protein